MECDRPAGCSLTARLNRAAGSYDISVQYFDLRTGASHFELILNGNSIAHWVANATLPPVALDMNLDGSTSTRFTVHDVRLAPGDTLTLRGTPDGDERAPVDYIEIERHGGAETR